MPTSSRINPDLAVPASVFLSRLRYQLWIRAREWDKLNEVGQRLVDRCIFSTYLTLVQMGSREEARAVLQSHRRLPLIQREVSRRTP